MSIYTVGILTGNTTISISEQYINSKVVSDSAFENNALDKSGPILKQILEETNKYNIQYTKIVPDEASQIKTILKCWSDEHNLNLVLVNGGTGFSPRDITPEVVKELLTRETPGITHLILNNSIKITPFAAISRPVTGIRNITMMVTLPGSPKACKENLDAILNILPHGLDLLANKDVKSFHKEIQSAASDNSGGQVEKQSGGHVCIHRHDVEGHASQTGQSAPLGTPVARRARSSPYPLIQVDDAVNIVKENTPLLNTINSPVTQFLPGHVLAEDVVSLEPVPGYRASIVDGYAIHIENGPGTYEIESISLASTADNVKSLTKGKIARVSTGGLVPEGATAVVMVEDTEVVEQDEQGQELKIKILVNTKLDENIRQIGSDCKMGVTIAKKGQLVNHTDLGTLVSTGIRHVKVHRKPRVGVLSSGNEVLDHIHTDNLLPGQIRDTNRVTLLSLLLKYGFESVDLGIVDDNVDDITERIEEALNKVDILITTGGVSMGEVDFMKPILEQKFQAKIHFGRVLMKPGKPTTFATIPYGKKQKLVFALPGNPVSATVTFHLFVLPAVSKMSGYEGDSTVISVTISHDLVLDSRPEYHRVNVRYEKDGFVASSTGNQQSSRNVSMQANGLLKLPSRAPQRSVLKKGSKVDCILISNPFS